MFRKNPRFLGMKFHHIARPETLEKRYIGKMSKRAMSFLKSLLEMDPNKRSTTSEALMHPYLEKQRKKDPFFSGPIERPKEIKRIKSSI